jgi:hypothetical protein
MFFPLLDCFKELLVAHRSVSEGAAAPLIRSALSDKQKAFATTISA